MVSVLEMYVGDNGSNGPGVINGLESRVAGRLCLAHGGTEAEERWSWLCEAPGTGGETWYGGGTRCSADPG